MSCTAILVNYFSAADTAGAVKSLLDDDSSLTVVVVDNSCSRVESDALVAALPSTVRVLISSENLGFGRACNWAVDKSDSEFIFLLNPDARVLPGCIARLIGQLKLSNGLGAVAPMQYLDDACHWMLPPSWFPTEIRAWAGEIALRDRDVARKLSRASRKEAVRYWTSVSPISQRALSGGMLMIRRSAIEASSPLFDPRFFMYFEDSDLCRRLKRRGCTFAMVPSAKGVHRWRNQSHKDQMMAKSAVLYFDKYTSANARWHKKTAELLKEEMLTPLLGNYIAFPTDGIDLSPGKWLCELSPSPLMSPAIGSIIDGSHFGFPAEVIGNFEGAPLFARIGPLTCSSEEDNCRYFKLNRS
ncbi:MAG: hypothetical protein CFE43_06980 [Burkholderiales bacterium PBB3]|nr:MAG: hypothetical protein CFE43_06980 [Burkholderiales bacterium PBB3]